MANPYRNESTLDMIARKPGHLNVKWFHHRGATYVQLYFGGMSVPECVTRDRLPDLRPEYVSQRRLPDGQALNVAKRMADRASKLLNQDVPVIEQTA